MRHARRTVAWSLLVLPLLLVAISACYTVKKLDRAAVEKEDQVHLLQLTFPKGYVILDSGWTVQFPYVTGVIDETEGVVPSDPVEGTPNLRRFNLDETIKIESFRRSHGKIAGLTVGAAVGAVAALALVISLISCPAVYVVDGTQQQHIVGEAYPGASFRSVQRDDLLPLPASDDSKLRIRLRNDNPEIQFTDSANLLLVEHARGERAVATHDGRVLLVRGSQVPLRAVDLDGSDVLEHVRGIEGKVWQSDLDRSFRAGAKDLREGVTATFEPRKGPLALAITAENTIWMSVVFHDTFSMMGGAFDSMMNAANTADRAGIEEWRAREGVDLRVEVWRDGKWSQAAMVQSPGMSALRTMVIPLGPLAEKPAEKPAEKMDEKEIQIRLSGGYGFWRIGSLALTTIENETPKVTRVSAISDARALLGEKDGQYHVLHQPGERLDLTFELPPRGTQERSAFLATSGYYNALPPPAAAPQLALLYSIRTTPGGMVRFANDLYAKNRDALYEEPGR